MANINPITAIERAAEVTALTVELFSTTFGLDFEDAIVQAGRQVDELLQFAADWDEQAATPAEVFSSVNHGSHTPAPAEPVYVPSALEPHEQRAMDKAMFERGRGLRPQVVGRFAFVPSRTSGGVIYRTALDGSSCNCQAGEAGKLCWHRMIVVLERELAA